MLEQVEKITLNGHFVKCCSYSPDGNYLAYGSDKEIKIWNIIEQKEEFNLGGFWVNCCCYSYDGNYLATGLFDKTVKIWDLKEQREEFTLSELSIYQCAYNSDRSYLATGSKTKEVKFFNIKERIEEVNLSNESEAEFDQFYKKFIQSSNENIESITKEALAVPIYSIDGLFTIKIKDNSKIICCRSFDDNEEFCLCYDTSKLKLIFFMENDKHLLVASEENIIKINFWNKLLYILHDSLSSVIIKRKDVKLLFKDAKVDRFICDSYDKYNQNHFKIEKQLAIIVSEFLKQFNKHKKSEKALEISKYLVKFAKLNYKLQYLDYDASRILTKYFSNTQNKRVNIELKYNIQILMFLNDSITEFENKQIIEYLLNELIELEEFQNREIDRFSFWNLLELKKFITIEELSNNVLFKTINNDYYSIKLFKSIYSTRKVLVKKYTINKNVSKSFIKSIESEFEKEAKCLEFLDAYRNDDNCFCEYFGSIKSNDSFSLVVKDSGMTLSDFFIIMEDRISKRKDVYSNEELSNIIKSLVQSFAFLEKHNILHRCINPLSFLIDENYNIKIIDFIHAAIKTKEIWKESDDLLIPKLENDYRSPEENIKNKNTDLQKFDVYSLGLVILQLVHLEKIDYIKKNLESLINDLERLDLLWLKKMLLNMLCTQPENRLNFSQLYKFIELDIKETIENSIID